MLDQNEIKTRPRLIIKKYSIFFILMVIVLLQACKYPKENAEEMATCKPIVEAQMDETLSNIETGTDFTLYLETEDGYSYTFSSGNSTITTTYESASTSKWVTATIILQLVDQGKLFLDDRPEDLIDDWPIDSSDPLYNMTLAELLSFTSGLTQEALCARLPGADFETCVKQIAVANAGKGKIPGDKFHYGGMHMQVAGLMAVKAAGVDAWQDLFKNFQRKTGLFPNGAYDLPSASNPRLAAGMHWRGDEFVDFIKAFSQGKLLTKQTQAIMMADHTKSAVMDYSPTIECFNVEWHYGLGIWLECPSEKFSCDEIAYYSSPGSYGAYPFFNRPKRYFGILAQQGANGSFANGFPAFEAVVDLIEQWVDASDSCTDGCG